MFNERMYNGQRTPYKDFAGFSGTVLDAAGLLELWAKFNGVAETLSRSDALLEILKNVVGQVSGVEHGSAGVLPVIKNTGGKSNQVADSNGFSGFVLNVNGLSFTEANHDGQLVLVIPIAALSEQSVQSSGKALWFLNMIGESILETPGVGELAIDIYSLGSSITEVAPKGLLTYIGRLRWVDPPFGRLTWEEPIKNSISWDKSIKDRLRWNKWG